MTIYHKKIYKQAKNRKIRLKWKTMIYNMYFMKKIIISEIKKCNN